MSAVCILAPTIIAGWPAISAAVAGAAAALGLAVTREAKALAEAETALEANQAVAVSVELAVEQSEIVAEGLATEEQIVLVKGDIKMRVYRDERGRCGVSVEGAGHSEEELRALGEELVAGITQMFVYNKVMTELKSKGFTVMKEELGQDEAVHIHVRRMVG